MELFNKLVVDSCGFPLALVISRSNPMIMLLSWPPQSLVTSSMSAKGKLPSASSNADDGDDDDLGLVFLWISALNLE